MLASAMALFGKVHPQKKKEHKRAAIPRYLGTRYPL
jgi:hypothetical protein